MYIKKLVIKNFKSFGKKTEIPFVKGFTVISGPNGSGKSNAIDSILFCLGLSPSTKQLRADRLTDLIHNGKSEAEVAVVFQNNNKESYEILRRIKVTEKGYYSYYYLNSKPVSLSDVHRFLSQYGIYSDAYNIVMQGDVTRITEMSPVQRRKIIDDIAGISEFDEKKEKALEELDKVRENIEKLDAVLAEVNDRLKSLEKDKNEALKYKSLIDEKERFEKYLRTHKYNSLITARERIEREIERLERQKDEATKRIPEILTEISTISEKVEELAEKISELGDERVAELQSRILELTSELESIKKSEKIYREEIRKIEGDIVHQMAEVSKLKDQLGECDDEVDELSVKRISIQEIVEELQARMDLLKIKLEEVDRHYKGLRDELLTRRSELEKLKEKRSELLRERDRLIESLRRINIEIEEIQTKIESLNRDKSSFEDEIGKLSDALNQLEKSLRNVEQQRRLVDNNLFSIRSALADVEEELKSKEVELAKVKAQLSTLQSYSKPVELILEARNKRALPGVFGTVAQLGEVNEEYATAIEAAAGNALQFIVVETEDDAVRAIKYLKAIKGGRAAFIPLNRIRKFEIKLDKSLLKRPGVIDYAVKLVRCEKRFEPVFRFVLKDTLVVDRIETARELMDEGVRIVTLDGDIIEKSGLMSGGSSEKKRGMLISRELLEKERLLSEKIVELQKKKEELFSELNSNEARRRDLQSEYEKLNSQIGEIRNSISLLEEKIKVTDTRIKENELKLIERKRENEEKTVQMKGVNEKIQNIEREINDLLKSVEDIERKLKGSEIPKLTEELEKVKDEYSRNREILISIERKIESLDFKRSQLESAINEREEKIIELEERKRELEEEIEAGRARIDEIEVELKNLREEEEKIGKAVKELRRERDGYLKRLRELEEEKGRLNFEISSIDDKIKIRMEKIQSIQEEIDSLGDVELFDELPPLGEVTRRLEEVEYELSTFGDVNLKAIQEYEEVRKRRDELLEKKLVLEKERSDIIERIERYEKRKRETFYETFNAINRNFAEIIRELANGEGELYLDSDDPFNSGLHIKVKPNNKPVQKLESMSGGEKSLVALALIFAIQMYKPAPFYAFDEVDMFLDGVNVSRVAKMIKKRSKDAQFIVVSLRKPMLENADAIVGITLGRDNSSVVTGIKMRP
jgi:chromosome segregation protein